MQKKASSPISGIKARGRIARRPNQNIALAWTVPVRSLQLEPPLGCKNQCDKREASSPHVSPPDASLTPFRQPANPAPTYRRSATVLALAAIMVSACASSPSRPGKPPSRGTDRPARTQALSAPPVALLFAGMDGNHDHIVSRAELDIGIMDEWRRLAEPDGAPVTVIRMSAWSEEVLGSPSALPTPVAFDSNLDGTITEIEFRRRLTDTFDTIDRDQDDRVTRAELLAAPMPDMTRAAPDSGRGNRGGPPPRGRQ